MSEQEEEKRECVCDVRVYVKVSMRGREGVRELRVFFCVCVRQINSSQRASERTLIWRLATWLTDPCIHIIGLKSLTRWRYNSCNIWDKEKVGQWERKCDYEPEQASGRSYLKQIWHTSPKKSHTVQHLGGDGNAVTGQYRGRRKRRSCCQIWASSVFQEPRHTRQG